MLFQGGSCDLEEGRQPLAQLLRVQVRGQLGRANEVGEDHRAELPLGALHRVEGRPAGGAEAGVVGHQSAAACAHLAHCADDSAAVGLGSAAWTGAGQGLHGPNQGARGWAELELIVTMRITVLGKSPVVAGRRRGLQRVPDRGRRHLAAARLRQRRVLEAAPVLRLHGRRRRAYVAPARGPLPRPGAVRLRAHLRAAPAAGPGCRISGHGQPRSAPSDRSAAARASASAGWSAPGATMT